MKVFYDWEFLDDGRVIEPISLGMVADDGRELYAVFQNIMSPGLYGRIVRDDWLMRNVINQLPLTIGTIAKPPDARHAGSFRLDRNNPYVLTKTLIRAQVRKFLNESEPVELWGYYSCYDHVLLGQLFGPRGHQPASMPMTTYDIVQLCEHLGRSEAGLPAPPQTAHNALSDAKWTRDAHRTLLERPGPAWRV